MLAVDAVLAMPGWADDTSASRLRALEAAGGLAYWAGDIGTASHHYGAAVVEARRLGDPGQLANALYNHFFAKYPTLSTETWTQALAEDDTSLLDEAIEIWTRLGDEHGVGKALWGLGEHHAYRQEYDKAEEVLTRALGIFERHADAFWIGWARFTRSFSRALAGRLADAASDVAVALREFRASRDVSGVVLLMSATASMLLMGGRPTDAHAVGAAARRAIAETGLHIANLWASSDTPTPDPEAEAADPALRAAAEEGASWSREDALDRTIALVEELAEGRFGDASRPA